MSKKYYELTPDERLASLSLNPSIERQWHDNQSVNHAQIIENYVTDLRLPVGVLKDIWVSGNHYTVPMAIEEPSVIAAANHGAKLLSMGGAISVNLPLKTAMVGQILFHNAQCDEIASFVLQHQDDFFEQAKIAKPSIYQRGGGLLSVTTRQVSSSQISVDFVIDTKDAMGANIVNTILESESTLFEAFKHQIIGVILSNYAKHQVVTVRGQVPLASIGGRTIADKIVALNNYGKVDVYRATTENKGIFNGLSAAVLATGNDWRAVEAAGHAYASCSGQYQSLTTWQIIDDNLHGELTMPISVGTVGGAISAMPQAKQMLDVLNVKNADELRGVLLSVGLAQNLAALKAIVDGGIQRGHMRMQYRALALQVGAKPNEVNQLAEKLSQLTYVDESIARRVLVEIKNER